MKKMKFLILFLAVAFLSSAAWSIGTNFHCNAPTLGGTASSHNPPSLLGTSSVIQRIYNSPGAPDPAAARFLHSGTWVADHHVGDGTGANGKFDFNTTSNQSTYLRVWENAGPARGGYYKTLGPYSPGDPMPTEAVIGDFQTDYLADVPPAPTVAAGGFKLTWDSAKSQYLVDFSLTAQPAASPKVEVVSYNIRVKKVADDWTAGKSHTGGAGWNITEDPDHPYFIAGGWYVAVASASNYFGTSAWGTENRFQIPTGGAGGGPETVTVHFVKPSGDLGVNTFSFPFSSVSSPDAVSNLKQLIQAVNSAAGKNVATVAGLWDKSKQSPAGYIITYKTSALNDFGSFTKAGDVPADPAALALVKDGAYQISVNEDNITLQMTGTR